MLAWECMFHPHDFGLTILPFSVNWKIVTLNLIRKNMIFISKATKPIMVSENICTAQYVVSI